MSTTETPKFVFSRALLEKANQAVIDGEVTGKIDSDGNFIISIQADIAEDERPTDNEKSSERKSSKNISQ